MKEMHSSSFIKCDLKVINVDSTNLGDVRVTFFGSKLGLIFTLSFDHTVREYKNEPIFFPGFTDTLDFRVLNSFGAVITTDAIRQLIKTQHEQNNLLGDILEDMEMLLPMACK